MAQYGEADVPDQNGKTILVTGANTGIGWDAARVLAERGARVLLACRDEDKARDAIDRIKVTAPDADLAYIPLDLTSLTSVKAAADQVLEEERLDALVNNAGVMVPPKMQTQDGFELQFGVNHLGHFALTGHLLPKLKDQPGARVINVSSGAHKSGHIDYDDLHAEKSYSRIKRYSMSKFANILFMYELQRRLEKAGSPAISVACHPGGANTDLGRHLPGIFRILFLPLSLMMNSSAEGALPTLMATTAADVQGGDYFGPAGMGEFARSAKKVETIGHSRDEADAARLWDVSTELTGVSYAF